MVGHHPVVMQSGRMPASTNLLSSASPMRDGTHSSSWLALTLAFFGLAFFGFTAPLLGAISRIRMETSGGSARGCESRNARAEEEDEMANLQRWDRGVWRRSYKALPPPFRIQGFLGNRSHDWSLSEFSATSSWAITWAFAQPRPVSPIYLRNLLWLTEYSSTSPPTVMAQ